MEIVAGALPWAAPRTSSRCRQREPDNYFACGTTSPRAHHAQCGTITTIDSAKIDAFARLMNEKLDTGDTSARKAYICAIVDAIEADGKAMRIIGSKAARTCCKP